MKPMNKLNKLIINFLKKLVYYSFRAFRRSTFFILSLFGDSRRKVIDAFLYGVIRKIWNSLPNSLHRFTIVINIEETTVKFRPFILHDFMFVLSNHEPFFKDIFRPKLGMTVVDAGAHIGLYTIKASKRVGAKGKVISVEPDPRNFKLLKENVQLNKLENVVLINLALSDFCGKNIFYECLDPSLSGLTPSSESPIYKPKLTEICTLDELLKSMGIREIDWLKIDVEGAESKVILGGFSILKNSEHVKILIESHNEDCVKILKKIGFKIKYLGEIYYFATK